MKKHLETPEFDELRGKSPHVSNCNRKSFCFFNLYKTKIIKDNKHQESPPPETAAAITKVT